MSIIIFSNFRKQQNFSKNLETELFSLFQDELESTNEISTVVEKYIEEIVANETRQALELQQEFHSGMEH
jgi:hypothetical protein